MGREIVELNGNWRIKDFAPGAVASQENAAPGLDDRYWMTGRVPGDVHSALTERRIVDSPYYGHNDLKSRWIEEREWWYRRGFEYDGERTGEKAERFELTFEGLDTFATVFVNGHEVGTASNMLMPHTFDVTRVIRRGWNMVAVRFDPLLPHQRDKERFDWSSYTKERPWLRKAAMNFGWDWGPRLVTVGIWGGVQLKRHRLAKIESVFVETVSIDDGEAMLELSASVLSYRGMPDLPLLLRVKLEDADGNTAYDALLVDEEVKRSENGKRTVGESPHKPNEPQRPEAGSMDMQPAPGLGDSPSARSAMPESYRSARRRQAAFRAPAAIRQPKLWWTHDLGEPHLYRLTAELYAGDERIDTVTQAVGVRTLELRTEDEEGRAAFRFFLNGQPVYARGANWIPADNMIGAIPDSRYGELIELSTEAGMNMLRVWAGGIYEKDVFYDECDRRGVLVWQDFAFANALFPDFNQDFMDNVRAEVEANVRRLRGRASLALWCGNNEIDWLYDMKTASGDIRSDFYGELIYHDLIPEVLELLDPNRPYWPSSPYGRAGDQDDNDPAVGDRHNWQVWHGSVYPRAFGEAPVLDYSIEGVTFKKYKQDMALFSSEFGMHASANRYTLEKNMPQGELVWGSEEMAYRNKDTNHRKGILLMEGYTGVPRDIEEYMNFSMLTQAEGLRYGVEHYRRNPRSGGSLIWQLNDSWPGTSWSMIDYELLPKASYYYAKKFYAPLLLSLEHEPGEPLRIWAVNDGAEAVEVEALLEVRRFDGGKIGEYRFHSDGGVLGPVLLGEIGETEALDGTDAAEAIVRLRQIGGGSGLASFEQTYMLRDHRELKLGRSELVWSLWQEGVQEADAAEREAESVNSRESRLGQTDAAQEARDIRAAWLMDEALAASVEAADRRNARHGEAPSGAASDRNEAKGGDMPNRCLVEIRASVSLARMVKLELPLGRVRFSDNYFDLLPGESRTVEVSMLDGSELATEFVRENMQVSAVNASSGRREDAESENS
ncbi:beta-mannosidase [Saccharibacillus sp. O23]|uniref:glycosyl hydrolase 2 galactose-binding domain-containing protein n=1 Tax=Saccharibacillus sp. O23 TaxID=2009338 RepID=UPI000B4E74DD|nr:glycoside hydrolase family 2 protein [Saccharibacillus sp. O23]OWR33100.1 beta-mannosidase [Saccharibacillus sp. O23]